MRIALGIEYNGLNYYGWQAQRGLTTIQGCLEEALSKIANENIFTHCAGRTDANVHAVGQVVHFDTRAKRHIDAWIWGTNTYLPPNIVVRWSRHVDYHFHARFSATARCYRYIIFNNPIRPALLYTRSSWCYYPLDIELMQQAANYLIGEHDFSSFRGAHCHSKTPIRRINQILITRQNHYVILDIEANAFLHHMVRNIAGSLLKVGSGIRDVPWMKEVLLARSRKVAAETASPDGLYLTRVIYPNPYTFPVAEPPFLL